MTRHSTINYHRCGGLSYDKEIWIIAILSASIIPLSYDLNDCTSHLLAVCNLSVTAWFSIKIKVSQQVLNAQKEGGMSCDHTYIEFHHSGDDSVVRFMSVPHFTPMEIP